MTDDPATPTVVGIRTAPGRRLPMRARDEVVAEAGKGLVGDRYHGAKHRHVTIQSAEDLAVAEQNLGRSFDPALTRRNLTISHGAVPTKPGTPAYVGEVRLEVVRVAAPCKLLDDTIGVGAQHAIRHRGGTVFRVLGGGTIRLGDPVEFGDPMLEVSATQ